MANFFEFGNVDLKGEIVGRTEIDSDVGEVAVSFSVQQVNHLYVQF